MVVIDCWFKVSKGWVSTYFAVLGNKNVYCYNSAGMFLIRHIIMVLLSNITD